MYKCLTKIKFGLTLCLSMYFFLFQAPLSSQVLTVLLPPCLLMAHLYCHRKVPHRVIPWQCPCILLVLCLYAISVVPVIRQLMGIPRQVWYVDDAAAGGSLLQLRDWWSDHELLSFSHYFGHHVNTAKTWLVVKEECWL